MFLTNFWLKYPELAEKETRILTILQEHDNLSEWDYVIQEMYCTDPKCDCQKVSFNIIWPNKEIYYLDYWFEKVEYYIKWWIWDKELAKEMSWLSVNTFSWDIEDNRKMFESMKRVLEDKKYVDRLKKHYQLMKEEVEWYKDPFVNDDFIFLDDVDDKNIFDINKSQGLQNKILKERKKKKLAKKQKQINRKKK